MEHLKQLFYENQNLFQPPPTHIAIWPCGRIDGTNYKAQKEALDKVHTFPWTWGKCFTVSQFIFYYLGGYDSDWELKCIKAMPFHIKGVDGTTSHWFVQNKIDDSIIDLTAEQFDGILDIPYADGRRANLGFPWYYVKGSHRAKKLDVNGKCVPSKWTLGFYGILRETEKNETLEKYWQVWRQAQS